VTVVNYHILGELFGLLERIELINGVAFADYDPDVKADVEKITEQFIKPSVMEATIDNQHAIAHAIAFYSQHEIAPIQLMKDRCQELTLPNAESWPRFFHNVGISLFGEDYLSQNRLNAVEEFPDENESGTILRRRH